MKAQKAASVWQESRPDETEVDMVNSPPHYNQTGIECIHAISAATGNGFKYYLQGNILKYLLRTKKDRVTDLKKLIHYAEKKISKITEENT